MPGPANYERKRMFDNKQAIDYTKRFQTSMQVGYNTTTNGFPNPRDIGSGQNWNEGKPFVEAIVESPSRKKLNHAAMKTNQQNFYKDIVMMNTQ